MRSECIDYRQLPGQNPLFLSYLYDHDRISAFYGPPLHSSPELLEQRAARVASKASSHPRQELVELLKVVNQQFRSGQETLANLERLASPATLAVVTGQQPGLFGGPAYTVYKAITAIRLAQILEESGYPTVPIFWLASDNSDFAEVGATSLLDGKGRVLEVRHPDRREDPAQMVGAARLSEVQECFETLEEHPPRGEFTSEMLALLRETYPSGSNFGNALGSWMARLFAPYGLILFDPLHPGYRRSAGPVFRAAIEKSDEIVERLRTRSLDLEAGGFEPQVRIDPRETLIYRTAGDRRYRLEFGDGPGPSGTGQRRLVGRKACLEELESEPETFVPNVLLRPIVQDFLLPTVAYVGGPAEVAYFSQVNAISPLWDQEMAVFPRLGLTVADRKAQRLLDRYGLAVTDLLKQGPRELSHQILRRKDPGKVLQRLERLRGYLDTEMEHLRSDLAEADPPVAQMVEGARKKITYQTEKIQNRFLSNKRNRDETLAQHLDYLYSRFYPGGQLQERVIGFHQFLSEEGYGFVRKLVEATDPFCPSHQIVYL